MEPASFATARLRLASQRLGGNGLASPRAVVAWMGAVQAQDRPAALWAIGLRMRNRARASDVERAVERGEIVRTWPMRGTLHLVAAENVRWMLGLLAPRVIRRTAGHRRQLGLSHEDLARSRRALRRALAGGQRLTRPAAYAILNEAGVSTRGQRGFHILVHLAMEGTLCLGPLEGKQTTLVLLDEWVPPTKREPARAEALAELARIYATSHGPVTAQDLAWWAGLPVADAREALALAAPHLVEAGGLWRAPRLRPARMGTAHALPAFDEFLVGYKDRRASLARLRPGQVPPAAGLLRPTMVLDGQVVALWTRALRGDHAAVRVRPLRALDPAERDALAGAAERYARFLGLHLDFRVLARG